MTATPEHASAAIKSVIYPNNAKQAELNAENAIKKVIYKKIVEQ